MTTAQATFLIIGLGMIFVVAAVADRKGYDKNTWALLGLLLWPAALAVILAKPPNPKMFRRCPDCGAQDVPWSAPVCRHCGRDERLQTRERPPHPQAVGDGEGGAAV